MIMQNPSCDPKDRTFLGMFYLAVSLCLDLLAPLQERFRETWGFADALYKVTRKNAINATRGEIIDMIISKRKCEAFKRITFANHSV